jgi:hypothetical protein
MKQKMKYCTISLIVLLLAATHCIAQEQEDSSLYRVETRDGNTYMGQIISKDSVYIHFNSDKLGEIKILQTDIKRMYSVDVKKIIDNEYWFENPQASRYFYAPNGMALKKGEGYFQNVWVLFNSFAVGVNDNFSVGGGLIPLFLFAGAPTPVWVTPKISIPAKKEKLSIGTGALLGTIVGESKSEFGILYGISTIGSKDGNLSLGLGYGYAGGEWAKSPMINLSGMVRVGANGYLLTENYFVKTGNTTTTIIWMGGRQIIKDWSLDYGLIIPLSSEIDEFIAVPWLGIIIPFGNQK